MTATRDETRPTSRGPRVVPVLLGLAVLVAIGAAASPGLRDQLAQSFSKQDKGYLEVFFVDAQAAQSCPLDEDGRVRLDVGVRSHFAATRSLAWTAAVSPTRGAVQAAPSNDANDATQRGRLDARPDRTASFTTAVAIPRTATGAPAPYSVAVAVAGPAGNTERLLLHC